MPPELPLLAEIQTSAAELTQLLTILMDKEGRARDYYLATTAKQIVELSAPQAPPNFVVVVEVQDLVKRHSRWQALLESSGREHPFELKIDVPLALCLHKALLNVMMGPALQPVEEDIWHLSLVTHWLRLIRSFHANPEWARKARTASSRVADHGVWASYAHGRLTSLHFGLPARLAFGFWEALCGGGFSLPRPRDVSQAIVTPYGDDCLRVLLCRKGRTQEMAGLAGLCRVGAGLP